MSEIVPYSFNNKIHSKEQIDAIKNSILECWYIADIVVDENNIILAGHWRFAALEDLWYKEIEVQKVFWLSETQKKKYRILDNVSSDLAEYNIGNIKIELEDIDDIQFTNLVCDIVEIDNENEDIDFDSIKSNEDRSITDKSKEIVCPECSHHFIV